MRPRWEPFLVSTLRPIGLKFRLIALLILITSVGETNSSIESITIPMDEYSRMELTSKIGVALFMSAPSR